MAKAETDVVHEIMKEASRSGARLFKNVRGGFYPIQAVKPIVAALLRGDIKTAAVLCKSLRPVMAGLLAPGASDLIGFKPVVITQEMVGKTLAVYAAVEVKSQGGRATPEQLHYIEFVLKNGGFAGVARTVEDARIILKLAIDTGHSVR